MATSFKQFDQENKLVESLNQQNLIEEIINQETGDWSKEMSAEDLLEELGLGDI